MTITAYALAFLMTFGVVRPMVGGLVLIEIVPAAGPADAGSVIHEEPGMLGKLDRLPVRAFITFTIT